MTWPEETSYRRRNNFQRLAVNRDPDPSNDTLPNLLVGDLRHGHHAIGRSELPPMASSGNTKATIPRGPAGLFTSTGAVPDAGQQGPWVGGSTAHALGHHTVASIPTQAPVWQRTCGANRVASVMVT